MSIGQPCRHCSRGKMRPIHFSWDQAVILCDNTKCKSVLDFSPTECIITKHVLHPKDEPVPSEFGLQCLLKDGSNSSSSSGVYSEARSSLPSPSQSKKSTTDEEVEYLLRSSYAPKKHTKATVSHPVPSAAVTHTQTSSEPQNPQLDSSKYDGFFELLGSLDLEPHSQPVQPEPQVDANPMETSFDIVTAELEGWMQDFNFNIDNNPSTETAVLDQRPPEADMQGPSFLSQGSSFTPIDTPKEHLPFLDAAQNSSTNSLVCQNSSVVNNEAPNYVQQFENLCFSTPFESEFVSGSVKNFDARFMSPTTSAASDDSGYNEAMAGAEPLGSEGNSKVSSRTTFLHSSLKTQNGNSFGKLTTPTSEDNLKDLIQNNLEWPVMSGMNTLTVLPAMVATEESIANPSQEPQSSPFASQPTASDETNTARQENRKQVDLSTDEQTEAPQVNSELHQDSEAESAFLGHHDIVSVEESMSVDATTVVRDGSEQLDSLPVETVPMVHENTPVDHGKTPTDSTPTPTHDGSEQLDSVPVETVPMDHENTPVDHGKTPTDTTPTHDGSEQLDSVPVETVSMDHENTPVDLGKAPTDTTPTPTHDGSEPGSEPVDSIIEIMSLDHGAIIPEIHVTSPSESCQTSITSPTPESSVSGETSPSTSEVKECSDVGVDKIQCDSPSDSSRTPITTPTPESSGVEAASHCAFSEAKPSSCNVDARNARPGTPPTVPKRQRKRRKWQGASRILRARKCESSDGKPGTSNDTSLDAKTPRARGRAKNKRLEEIKKKVKRKGKRPRLKPQVGKVTERPGSAGMVHLKEELRTTSPWDNYFLERTDEELEGGGSLELPGGQTSDGGICHLGPRMEFLFL